MHYMNFVQPNNDRMLYMYSPLKPRCSIFSQAAQKVCPKTGPSMAAFWHVRPASRFWQPLIMR